MTEESLTVRVVRAVAQAASGAAPRWLTATDVIDACPDDSSGNIYATLSNSSKNADRGLLLKRRNHERGGLLEYTTRDGFDLETWLKGRGKTPAPKNGTSKLEEPEVQIVKAILRAKRRLTRDEIEGGGDFSSTEALVLRLADLVRVDGVLERDREEVGKPWVYGVRRDVDIAEWLRQRGSSLDGLDSTPIETKTAAPPTGQRVPPQDARTASAAAPRPEDIPGLPRLRAEAAAAAPEQKTAAPPATARAAPSQEGAEPARVAAPVQQTAGAQVPAIAASVHTERPPPAAPAEPKRREPLDLITEMAILSAALLAAEVRALLLEFEHVIGPMTDLERALRNFERADKLREEAKAGRG